MHINLDGIFSHTTSYHSESFTPTRVPTTREVLTPGLGENVEHEELPFAADGNVNWYNRFGKKVRPYLTKINLHIFYPPAIPLLCYVHQTNSCPKVPGDMHDVHSRAVRQTQYLKEEERFWGHKR